jgi:hypothetical protein
MAANILYVGTVVSSCAVFADGGEGCKGPFLGLRTSFVLGRGLAAWDAQAIIQAQVSRA